MISEHIKKSGVDIIRIGFINGMILITKQMFVNPDKWNDACELFYFRKIAFQCRTNKTTRISQVKYAIRGFQFFVNPINPAYTLMVFVVTVLILDIYQVYKDSKGCRRLIRRCL